MNSVVVLNLSVDFNLSFSRVSLVRSEHTICIYVLIYVNGFRDLTWFGFLPDFEHNWTYMLFLSRTNVTSVLWEPLKDFFFCRKWMLCARCLITQLFPRIWGLASEWLSVETSRQVDQIILTRSLDSEKKLCCVCRKVKTLSWILA